MLTATLLLDIRAVLFVRSSVFGCLELSGARSQSVVLVMTTVKPLFSNSCLRAIAILRLTSFSMTPEVEILPGSLPPWPGSITITVELVFLPVFFARAQTPLPR